MPRRYPSEFRRKVLDLVRTKRSVRSITLNLDIGARTIRTCKAQQECPRNLSCIIPGIRFSHGWDIEITCGPYHSDAALRPKYYTKPTAAGVGTRPKTRTENTNKH